MRRYVFVSQSLRIAFCLAAIIFAAPDHSFAAAKAQPKPVAQKPPVAKKQQTATKPAPQAAADKLQSTLDAFAKDCVSRMNRQRRPGIDKKEVKRQQDGSYIARYLAVDPDSLTTSYNPTAGHKTIPYIGRMDYHEVEYVNVGKTQKQALAGPFSETNRVPVTELVKYKNKKWTY